MTTLQKVFFRDCINLAKSYREDSVTHFAALKDAYFFAGNEDEKTQVFVLLERAIVAQCDKAYKQGERDGQHKGT